jgi:hypothetical protein
LDIYHPQRQRTEEREEDLTLVLRIAADMVGIAIDNYMEGIHMVVLGIEVGMDVAIQVQEDL